MQKTTYVFKPGRRYSSVFYSPRMGPQIFASSKYNSDKFGTNQEDFRSFPVVFLITDV